MLARVQLLEAAFGAALPEEAPGVHMTSDQFPGIPEIITKMVAISEAESGGHTRAVGCNTNGTGDYGWLQINSVNGGSPASFDPKTCAQQAVSVFHARGGGPAHPAAGLSAWSTYNGPRYAAALPAATAAMARYQAGLRAAEPSKLGKTTTGCVYGWKLPSGQLKAGPVPLSPTVGGETICFDVIVGGLKMTAGGLGVLVSMLSLAFSVRRLAPATAGAVDQAGSQVRRSTTIIARTGTRPATLVRRQARAASARRTATARAAEQTTARQRAEARADYNARTARVRAGAQGQPRTVYVTDEDPMAETYKRRARQQAEKRAQDRAEAQRRHGDPDAPPF